ncbi:MAG: MBL fold metallo-hydrolase [Geminocystis sp.]|nr:MBL fold metallo-hydrolase [Geminocystis sp.]HIK38239.1 MBL fold metallo-hydrolase [Geminocystis sp. M7585_C2015_104]MCS7146632.1 MBL fold metallo-hydrolase [Geminocystis sp.]MCX8077219.1 MBL fold metallo-hydrolase [Geminocystis sp.]MDW8115458.1 MBL fold metallo-hydrolase [Geminocystis sp.]
MKRRDWIFCFGGGLATVILWKHLPAVAQNNPQEGVTIQWLGHSAFLFTNSQARILVNPFSRIGCTAKYPPPNPSVDIVMISSRLLDEGSVTDLPDNPKLMFEPGVYQVKGIEFQGIKTLHDREKGRRFGINVAWRWRQGGLNLLHLGGIASPIGIEEKILMGSPDVVFIPVGGTAKTYNAKEAIEAIKILTPKVVFPTQYLTAAADKNNCNLEPVDSFLALAKQEGMAIGFIKGNRTTIRPKDLPQKGTLIRVFQAF